MSIVTFPEEKLDQYIGEEPEINLLMLQKSTMEHCLHVSMKPKLQGTA